MALNNLIMMCVSVDLFEFVLFGVCGASYRCRLMYLNQIWETLGYYFFKCFYALIYLSPTFGILIKCMLIHLIVSHRSLRLCSFFFILFPPVLKTNWTIFKFLDSSPTSDQFLSHSYKFFISVLYFSTQKFDLLLLNNFCLLIFSIWWDIILIL